MEPPGNPGRFKDAVDAFLKRYEQLVLTIREELFADDPDRQARNLNEAYATVPEILAAYENVRRYLERRLPGIGS